MTVVLSLLLDSLHDHSSALQEFVEWCEMSCLELNVSKTKEMIVIFSPERRQLAEAVITTIQGKPVEVVEEYKYLGAIFDNQLKFSSNTEEILKKYHQQYLHRKLKSFDVNKNILHSTTNYI